MWVRLNDERRSILRQLKEINHSKHERRKLRFSFDKLFDTFMFALWGTILKLPSDVEKTNSSNDKFPASMSGNRHESRSIGIPKNEGRMQQSLNSMTLKSKKLVSCEPFQLIINLSFGQHWSLPYGGITFSFHSKSNLSQGESSREIVDYLLPKKISVCCNNVRETRSLVNRPI